MVENLLRKVTVREDPGLTALLPDIRAARVEISLVSGERFQARSDKPIGGFDNPIEAGDLLAKFRTLAGQAIAQDAAEAIARKVEVFETVASIRGSLTGLVSGSVG